MSDKRIIASYLLSASLFCLAAAIIYFTFVVTRFSDDIPEILSKIENTSVKIKPVVEEVHKIRELIPSVITEVSGIRQQIPGILEELKQVRETVPSILTEAEAVREITPTVLAEAKAVREVIPSILQEVKTTRETIPQILAKSEKLLKETKTIGKDASEGAVTGFFSGIIKAPFKMVGSLSKNIFGSASQLPDSITKKDVELATNTAYKLLVSGEIDESHSWSNADSGNNGKITLKEIKKINGRDCRILHTVVHVIDKKDITKVITACLDDNAEWETINLNY